MKRYIVYPTDHVPLTSIVSFYGVPADECVNARRREEIAGLDVSRLIPLHPDNTDSRACKCGGIDTDGDGDCHLCSKCERGKAMSDTPRTDEAEIRCIDEPVHPLGIVEVDFARQLERELADANERIRQMHGWREYADCLEDFAEVHMSTFMDRDKWNEVKAGRPKDE